MPSHSERLGIWLSVWRFLLTHCLYERSAEARLNLRCSHRPIWAAAMICIIYITFEKQNKKKKKKKKKKSDARMMHNQSSPISISYTIIFYKWACSCQNQQNDLCAKLDSDQPGHPPSLIRVFAERSIVAKDAKFLHADSEDSDQTGRMTRLI